MANGPTPGYERFAFRYGIWRWLLTIFGSGPWASHVDVGAADVRVALGWSFRARVPRAAIVDVRRDVNMRWGVGVHGWGGRWLVNGATTGIVTLTVDPPARAHVLGVPVRLRILHVSLVEPERFVAAVAPANGSSPEAGVHS